MRTPYFIMKELQICLDQINEEEYEHVVQLLREDRTLHFFGEGRSGLVAKMIAMRLMHSGKKVYVIGETISPAIKETDVCVLISGSAKTKSIHHIASQAKKNEAKVFLITANKAAFKNDVFTKGLWINAATKYDVQDEPKTIQPLGNQFDQLAHIVLDGAVIDSVDEMNMMMENHTNVE